ncbi:MAG: nucleoside deaminase [Bacteroidales bacterium]
MITERDIKYLKEAISIADENINDGGGPFGALIVKDDTVISASGNRVVNNCDPTAHAEVLAIRIAAEKLGSHILDGCLLYSSCEPCPMCLGAIYWSGIRRVVFAATRHDAAAAGFSDEHIYDEISLDTGQRSIEFINLEQEKGREVFRKWIDFPGKIPY